MRIAGVVVLIAQVSALVSGCGSTAVAPDSLPIPRCETWTFAPHLFDPCAVPDGTIDVQLTRFENSYRLDGATGVFYRGDDEVEFTVPRISIDGISIISMQRLVIGRDASLSVVGPEPVVLVAWEDIDAIGGITSVPSQTMVLPAAGSPAAECTPPTAGSGESGSGGGGFQGSGGAGGLGSSGVGGAGGVARSLPDRLTAGCDGADGTTAGTHGLGGGGVAVVARTSITIQSVATVSGGRGQGTGAGGGAGGMIELEAPLVTIAASAEIFACGGPGALADPSVDSCLAIAGVDGIPGSQTASTFGGGGSGGAGFLVLRAHDEAVIDPLAAIAPAFAIR